MAGGISRVRALCFVLPSLAKDLDLFYSQGKFSWEIREEGLETLVLLFQVCGCILKTEGEEQGSSLYQLPGTHLVTQLAKECDIRRPPNFKCVK